MSAPGWDRELRERWEAVELLPAGADRGTWLQARSHGLGGSDASVVAGLNPWRTRAQLWADKRGQAPEQVDSDAMRWGRLLEPALVQAFSEDTGLEVAPCGLLAHRDRDWQRYTPDGLVSDGGLLECKTTSHWNAGDWDGGRIADHAALQVQHGMAVTGLPHAWVVVLVDGRDFRLRRMERDPALIHTLTQLETKFWHEHVLGGVVPPMEAGDLPRVKGEHVDVPDGSRLEGDQAALELVEAVRCARAEASEAGRKREAAEAQLLALMADKAELSVHGAVVATARNGTTTRLDVARLRAERPDLCADFLTTKSSRTLRLK